MFGAHMPGNNQGVSRPFVVGLILLLLFLSVHTDWTPGSTRRGEAKQMQTAQQIREGVKEKILLELSVVNDKLETENTHLKQYVLDLRRSMRGCGCELNSTQAAVFPELHDVSDDTYGGSGAAAGGAGGGGNSSSSDEGGGGGERGGPPAAAQPNPLPIHKRSRKNANR